MTLKEAKALRDYVRSKSDTFCTVPLGHGPDGYFARIFTSDGFGGLRPIDFRTRLEFRNHRASRLRDHRSKMRMYARLSRPRSPIEIMIDRACGLE